MKNIFIVFAHSQGLSATNDWQWAKGKGVGLSFGFLAEMTFVGDMRKAMLAADTFTAKTSLAVSSTECCQTIFDERDIGRGLGRDSPQGDDMVIWR